MSKPNKELVEKVNYMHFFNMALQSMLNKGNDPYKKYDIDLMIKNADEIAWAVTKHVEEVQHEEASPFDKVTWWGGKNPVHQLSDLFNVKGQDKKGNNVTPSKLDQEGDND